jgi:hypothetical protein
MAGSAAGKAGTCCSALDAALHADEFEPTITIDDDGVLCLTVGITDIEEEEPTLVLEPMIFCPFCGARQKTAGEDTTPAEGR